MQPDDREDAIAVSVVVPTCREREINKWFSLWSNELKNTRIIVIEDNPTKTFEIEGCSLNYVHYSWQEIDQELKEFSWIIPRRSDCVRSFGLYKAWASGADVIITMDDDCYPDDQDFVKTHLSKLNSTKYPKRWFQLAQTIKVRGVPHELDCTSAVVNMGLWSHVPDLDAIGQLMYPDLRIEKSRFSFALPFGYFAPISGMNLAFRREAIPASYFLLMGNKYPYDRFGDIWMGLFLKKICDHLGVYITGGNPYVRHEKASNGVENYKKESPAYEINESLWKHIDNIKLEGDTFEAAYRCLSHQLPFNSKYWVDLRRAMAYWCDLFK